MVDFLNSQIAGVILGAIVGGVFTVVVTLINHWHAARQRRAEMEEAARQREHERKLTIEKYEREAQARESEREAQEREKKAAELREIYEACARALADLRVEYDTVNAGVKAETNARAKVALVRMMGSKEAAEAAEAALYNLVEAGRGPFGARESIAEEFDLVHLPAFLDAAGKHVKSFGVLRDNS